MGTERSRPARGSDHEHVGRISTQTTIVLLIVIAVILHEIQWILLPFVVSGLLAYVSTPLIEGLSRRTGMPRWAFALATFTILVAAGASLGLLAFQSLSSEIEDVVGDFQGGLEGLLRGFLGSKKIDVLGQSMDATQLAGRITAQVHGWIDQSGGILLFGGAAIGALFVLSLSLVLLFYFLLDGPRIARGLLWLVPPNQRPLIRHIWGRLDPVLRRYFVGIIIVVSYATTAAYIGLGVVLGIPHAVFLALLTGFLEMIPVIGPAASAVIAGLIAVHHADGIQSIIAYAIYATALRLSIDQIFGPLALGTAARLHPTLIIFCFLSGAVLFGITGLILAVPVALIVKTTLAILYDEPTDEGTGTSRK